MIYLRAADALDVCALAELRAAALTELGLVPPGDVTAFARRAAPEFTALLRAGRLAAWVACDDARVVAMCCAVFYDRLPYPEGSRHAELCGVYVAPAYRRRGFASELVREVVAAAEAGGARKTYLRPTPQGKPLYARLGFVETELMAFAGARPSAASDPVLAAWPSR